MEGETKGGSGEGITKKREGVVGGTTEWEREGRERGTEEGTEGETKAGSGGGLQRQGGRDGVGGREGGMEEGR